MDALTKEELLTTTTLPVHSTPYNISIFYTSCNARKHTRPVTRNHSTWTWTCEQ